MTIFKSRQVNLDPEPYVTMTGDGFERTAEPVAGSYPDPRPEFEPTRDPHPWACVDSHPGLGKGTKRGDNHCHSAGRESHINVWAPDREQFDTPVNPILVAFREYDSLNREVFIGFANDLATLDWSNFKFDPTPEQVDHARRVLTRLAALQGVTA